MWLCTQLASQWHDFNSHRGLTLQFLHAFLPFLPKESYFLSPTFCSYQFKNGNNHKIFRLFLMAFHFKSQVSLLQSSTFPLLRFSCLNKPLIHKNRLLCLVMRLVTNNSGNMIDFLSRQVVCLKTVCGGKIRLESVLFWFGLNVSCFGWLSFERKLKMERYFD